MQAESLEQNREEEEGKRNRAIDSLVSRVAAPSSFAWCLLESSGVLASILRNKKEQSYYVHFVLLCNYDM